MLPIENKHSISKEIPLIRSISAMVIRVNEQAMFSIFFMDITLWVSRQKNYLVACFLDSAKNHHPVCLWGFYVVSSNQNL